MATKMFNIGESAIGGRIEVTVTKSNISITCREWDTKEPVLGHSANIGIWIGSEARVLAFLCDQTTSYWASKINDWIISKAPATYKKMGNLW